MTAAAIAVCYMLRCGEHVARQAAADRSVPFALMRRPPPPHPPATRSARGAGLFWSQRFKSLAELNLSSHSAAAERLSRLTRVIRVMRRLQRLVPGEPL